jgi:hypothetical protein
MPLIRGRLVKKPSSPPGFSYCGKLACIPLIGVIPPTGLGAVITGRSGTSDACVHLDKLAENFWCMSPNY